MRNTNIIGKIGFGGGCHWCTEAYFQSLIGVEKVEQGWISSATPNGEFSEAVIVHYNPLLIPLKILIAIHLHTHASTKKHSFRGEYRSAVYIFDGKIVETQHMISEFQIEFDEPIITEALLFNQFKSNSEMQHNYYKKNKAGVFCERYISPKLKKIEMEFATYFKQI
ncbi:MAG: peptide-methionine (S)-S-oxide reductase [Opitutaceae bacterium]|nr:peptide-methionine (S)-S-oxide reductase [Cytophagales bacterium]